MELRARVTWFLLPLALFFLLGATLVRDFPVYYDDLYETRMAHDNVVLLFDRYLPGDTETDNDDVVANLEYYGTFFNLLAYPFQQLAPESKYVIKQYVIFAFSLLAYVALAVAVFQVTRSRWSGWLALVALALQPSFFDASFTNPKDLPFAVMMTVAALVGANAIGVLQSSASSDKDRRRWLVAIGLAIGLCASVRIAGIALFPIWVACWLAVELSLRTLNLRRLATDVLWAALAVFVTVWVMHPVAYFNPIGWMYQALLYHAHHPYHAWVLTDGEWLNSHRLPWYYLPKWIHAKTPLLWQALALAGIVRMALMFKHSDARTRALALLFLAQLLALPLAAIAAGSHIYAGIRHFQFIFPAMAFFSAVAVVGLFQRTAPYRNAALAVVGIAVSFVAVDMAKLHPHEQSYFIEPLRADVATKWYYGAETVTEPYAWVSTYTDATRLYTNIRLAQIDRYAGLYTTRRLQVMRPRALEKATRPYYLMLVPNYVNIRKLTTEGCELKHELNTLLGQQPLSLAKIYYCK